MAIVRVDVLALVSVLVASGALAGSAGKVDPLHWDRVGEDVWTGTNGAVAAGPAEAVGFLVSPAVYGDFIVSLDYWVEDDTNSGIYIRCSNDSEINPDTCYEINIWDNHPNQASRTGSIVKFVEPALKIDGLERWVRVEIHAAGNRIEARFDDEVTAVLTNDRSPSGNIALQYAGKGVLKFRNVVIEAQ